MKFNLKKIVLFTSFTALLAAALITSFVYFTKIYDKDSRIIQIIPEPVPLAEAPDKLTPAALTPASLTPAASGVNVKTNANAEIDYSNTKDGYIMIRYTKKTDNALKVIVEGPSSVKYTYNLKSNGEYEVYPLSDGNGNYKIGVYENISGVNYALVVSISEKVTLNDEFAPFLRTNQYVNFTTESNAVKIAAELTKNTESLIDTVSTVYNYVIKNISYDKELAANVKSGYVPDIDAVLKKGKGICFDYAALMTAMLRSQMIPTKLAVGYTGDIYHAWISVYSEETGWIDNIIYFDGLNWKLMDPTLASGNSSKEDIGKFIGDGKNYITKYLY